MILSVIIPTYKPTKAIDRCIETLDRQTLDHTEFEVIIVLNGCDQPYRRQLDTLLLRHPHLQAKMVQTDRPGVSNARNIGIDMARGDRICFVDDDDWLSDNYLSALFATDNSAVVVSNAIQIDDVSRQQVPHFLTEAYAVNATISHPGLWRARSFFSTAWGKSIPRSVIGDTRFDPRFRLGEDSLFMFALSYRVKHIKLANSDVVYYIRQHADSASRADIGFADKARTLLLLTLAYVGQWLRRPLAYNFPLFLSRVAATLYKFFIPNYR